MLKTFRTGQDPAIPDGRRVYAIGDVHGRLDLLDILLAAIATDHAARRPATATLVLLGDLIDRGPDSRGVVARARRGVEWAEIIALMGNHEAILLDVLRGDRDLLANWLRFGGRETLASWGVSPVVAADGTLEDIHDAAIEAVSSDERAWIEAMPSSVRIGGYYFVHAGIRPGVALDQQSDEDRLWIREPFLDSRRRHGAVVVHGHSISEQVEQRPNRIGIDTGAYMSGRLSAIGLEAEERWLLST